MIRTLYYIAALSLIMAVLPASAQDCPKIKKSEFITIDVGAKEAWKAVKTGNKYYKKGKEGTYRSAASYYEQALDYNDAYAPLLYRAGVSEVMVSSDTKAMRHLSDALDLTTLVAPDCQYWLGVSKQHLNMFNDAKSDFDDCVSMFDKRTHKGLDNSVKLRLAQCDIGIWLSGQRDKAVTMPVPGSINTAMPEIAPVFSNDDSLLFYGSKNPELNLRPGRHGKELDQSCDILYAKGNMGKFGEQQNARYFNKGCDDYPGAIALASDNLFVVRKYKKVLKFNKQGDRYVKEGKLFKKVASVTFNKDSTLALFCARKGKDHVGGYDIYMSKYSKGKYGKPKNVGDILNSKYDEVMPYFGPNDTVVYYATNGQLSCGGFDIMKVSFRNGKFGKPENMGLGMNSGTDDNFFQLSPGEVRVGYYASKKKGGLGDYDIYKVLLLYEPIIQMPAWPGYYLAADLAKEPMLPLEGPEVIKTMRLTVVKGKVTDYDNTKNLYAKIVITDNATNQVTQQIMTDSETGEFTVMLESGKNYAMTVSSDGYLFHSENFDIPSTSKYQEIHKDIKLLPMDPGSKVVLNNVFFDTGKSDLRPESFGELQRLSEVFKLYPSIVIEVSGHTDNQGNRQYNITLSQNRANAVRDYLISLGVGPEQVVAKGYGPDQPRDTNATPEGRQNNRRVEAKILSN